MKRYQFSLAVVTVFVLVLFFSAIPSSYAKKPVRTETAATLEVYSVVVDQLNSKILVTGNGLDGITTATLGGVDVSGDFNPIDSNNAELNFSTAMETAVPGKGNYFLVLNGTVLSVYMTSAIVAPPPGTATCPCETFWVSYGGGLPPVGFSGLTPECVYESPSGDQASVRFYNEDYFQHWILTTEYNENAQECALVFDVPTETLSNPQEHAACVSYLKTNYIDPYSTGPSCL